METARAIPVQETGSGYQPPVNPDGFVTIDVESFTPVFNKDFSSSSPRITLQRSVSRKGSPRSNNNERKLHCDANGNDSETSFPQSPLRGTSTPEKMSIVGSTDNAGTPTATATAVSASPLHQITITTAAATAGNMISDQNRERRFGFARKSSFKRSHTSWLFDPKKVVLFFATLSSMGSILLIIFTLSISKSNLGDMPLE
ncbi:hypothetical protein BRARA_A01163 [Brassica rapa]|uniref:Transmembrane protein n=4 Tax=Brassica TaxID=3705 RepID=A0A398ARR0_BRACM|nr:uncharacterized protein LOC103858880 [Brassica rapa]XP_009134580.1 uncharacterized protein LOC103858880 [Brassica rapa]XP_013737367.1 uncharacterized protein BNAA01G11140D isoform X1 [Brassica napus]KAG5413566.1 hypothetical protein IGI04_001133 [Brassica rapa subsp. trilocularis]KAH0941501.1 hypothetical protein HID58_001138 [Brassica napus]RID78320.1 hypothetical protein BRARA_A01163 [Brassica rapa]CAF2148926.1 unnamed protein product [Brassica napus]VDC74700.1 unnamed protein product [